MVKLVINHWQLKQMITSDPDGYRLLREADSRVPSIEEFDSTYFSFERWVNDISVLPNSILKYSSFEAIEPLVFVNSGCVQSSEIEKALVTQQVYLPDTNLLKIRKTKVLENCCTDELQKHLEHGWRILCICPQPTQRRPDYILGSFDSLE